MMMRLNKKSRMKREFHVRFCEGFGVKFHLTHSTGRMKGMREMALKTAFKYSEVQEKLRMDLQALDTDARVLEFYGMFKGLLPARTGPIRDKDIAGYLMMTKELLKRTRIKLRKNSLLK